MRQSAKAARRLLVVPLAVLMSLTTLSVGDAHAAIGASTTWLGTPGSVSTSTLGGLAYVLDAQSTDCVSVVVITPATGQLQDCSVTLHVNMAGAETACTGLGVGTATISQSGVPARVLTAAVTLGPEGNGTYVIFAAAAVGGTFGQVGGGTIHTACLRTSGDGGPGDPLGSWDGEAEYVG